jgi:hypothetical protein
MITIETMKWRLERQIGDSFPLVMWPGAARVVDVNDSTIDLLVAGRRADLTWDRVRLTWERLLANHELSVAELGGQHDAVGLVSLLAHMQPDVVDVYSQQGLLRLRDAKGVPVHQPTAPTVPPGE